MNTNIFIPKRIKVGFQERRDTYTGKLAYVIYFDEKNKIRKEASWNSWRSNKIEPEEYENEPISGFVLNKKAGGVEASYGWNARLSYCRVYDPRGFEFEIGIDNLLYILENTNSIRGKGLEGEFVYGWSNSNLILIPVESPDYKEISKYTEAISTKSTIKGKELVPGYTYLDKKGRKLIYLGRFTEYNNGTPKGQFYNFDVRHFTGWSHRGTKEISSIISLISDVIPDNFSELVEERLKENDLCGIKETVYEKVGVDELVSKIRSIYYHAEFIYRKKGDSFERVSITKERQSYWSDYFITDPVVEGFSKLTHVKDIDRLLASVELYKKVNILTNGTRLEWR